MMEREVILIGKDVTGKIISFKNQFKGWSPVSINDAIKHIEGELYSYYANFDNIGKVEIKVVKDGSIKVIGTDPKKTDRNILTDLPSYTISSICSKIQFRANI
ncbi:MAG: DUF3892 domain-containing protein [Ignavibacteriae bacterium]|nr:DUF3892 domain-containing protein [Ignavibacteriota bacterium]